MNPDQDGSHSISALTGLSYAMPLVPVLLMMNSLNVIQGIYAKHYGLALTTISVAMFIAGLFDAITDPAVGWWSDRHHARTGSRRPFIVGGMLLSVPCAWFLFVPVGSADGEVGLAYFVFFYMAFYLGVTLVQIPHMALGGELPSNPGERSRLYGYRTFGGYVGLTCYLLIPLLPFFATTEITPETMRFSVTLSALLMLPSIFFFLRFVPTARHQGPLIPPENPFREIAAVFSNRPYLLYLPAYLCFNLSIGVFYGLLFIVTDIWLGLGEYYVRLSLFHLVIATVMIRPAIWLIGRFGTRRTWIVATVLAIVCSIPIALLLLERGESSLALLFVAEFLLGCSSALGNVALPSLLMDIIDYDRFKSGRDRCATYFAVNSLSGKIGTTTLGYPLGVGLVGVFGFDPANPVWDERTLFGFQLAMGWIPAAIAVAAVGLMFLIPLNARRRAIIRKRLKVRETRKARAAVDIMAMEVAS